MIKNRIVFIILGAITMIMSACSSDDNDVNNKPDYNKMPANTQFQCGAANVHDPQMSRTMLNSDRTIWWVTDDKVSVYGYDNDDYTTPTWNTPRVFTTKEMGASVVFSGYIDESEHPQSYIATYGCTSFNSTNKKITFNLPSEQTLDITDGSHKQGFCTVNPSWAFWKESIMNFKNICAYLHCSINSTSLSTIYNENNYDYTTEPIDDPNEVTKIIVESTDDAKTPLTGDFTCTANTDNGNVTDFSSTNGGTKLIVNIPKGHFDEVYIPVPTNVTKLRVTLVGKNVTEYNYTINAESTYPLVSSEAHNFVFGNGVYYLIKDVENLGMKFSTLANANEKGLADDTNMRWVKWSSSTMPAYLTDNALKTADFYVSGRYCYHQKIKTVGTSTISETQLSAMRDWLKGKYDFTTMDFYRAKYQSTSLPDQFLYKYANINDFRIFPNVIEIPDQFANSASRLMCVDLLNVEKFSGSSNFAEANSGLIRALRMAKVKGVIPELAFTRHSLPYIQLPEGVTQVNQRAFQTNVGTAASAFTDTSQWIDLPSSLVSLENQAFGTLDTNNYCKTVYIRCESDYTSAHIYAFGSVINPIGNAVSTDKNVYLTQVAYDKCNTLPAFQTLFNPSVGFTVNIKTSDEMKTLLHYPYRSDYWMRTDNWK